MELWDEAMIKEMKGLGELKSFKIVPRPRGANVIQSTWAFKKKIHPDGGLKKYNAHFCVRDSQQIEGVDVFEIYAPVVTWVTVRTFLVLSLMLNLHTQQIDYTNGFFQAQLDQTMFAELPRGFESPKTALLLLKSVYGLHQRPLNFYKKLRKGLEDHTFQKSTHDDYLFINDSVVVLFWVDDCIFYTNEYKYIEGTLKSLEVKFLFEKEEYMADFLGIQIERDKIGMRLR